MRIIAGKYKGKKLVFPEDKNIRPTADLVKEALFAHLYDVEELNFLDLFCGCGGIGIEAISRGAKLVHFVDSSSKSLFFVKQNLSDLIGDFKIFKTDYLNFLKKTECKYDIIFIDPPYANFEYYTKSLNIIKQRNLLNDGGVVICEHDNNLKLDVCDYEITSTKKYGKKFLTYLKSNNSYTVWGGVIFSIL